MAFKYVIAILRPEAVPALEAKLTRIGVGGITLTRVKGFGNYKNFFSGDWLTEHAKAELFVDESHLGALLGLLREAAGSDVPGTGVVAVMPVEDFFHLRKGAHGTLSSTAARSTSTSRGC
ncbi:MAG: P-II family nitrogen regulator [Burkholderiales bacterium]|nr:P-II family nitrogen regulator [Burkholderiales bacterium]